MPWRGETDPYKIWISEIILQQTRVNQGWNYYLHFIEQFPDIISLAAAPIEKVLTVWQGLGYYSRARNLHAAAQTIIEKFNCKFPDHYQDILSLKGIGGYTAAAIGSIAFNLPYPAIDGNLFRVVCRLFGIFDDIALPTTKKLVEEKCRLLVKEISYSEFNQAMMDFGSLQCIPKNPDCERCPFADRCYAFQQHAVANLPVKINKIKVKERWLHYFLVINDRSMLIRQREGDDIWNSLFELPLIETPNHGSQELSMQLLQLKHPPHADFFTTHKLTHQKLNIYFYIIRNQEFHNKNEYLSIPIENLNHYPFPKVIQKFLLDFTTIDTI
jgi:A/G-specific adenine glycosylase